MFSVFNIKVSVKGVFMNIQQIIPNFRNNNLNNTQKTNNSALFRPNYSHTLAKDTVSFSGKLPNKADSIIGNAVEQSYFAQMGKFVEYAKNFHKALKNACEKLKEEGFVYDEVYNSKHPIKSRDSYMDKFERQGYVQDTVRGTVYWTDQQNIPAFKKFIDAMKEEGYEIATVRSYNSETEKFTRVPDLEIRQSGITEEDLEPLGAFLKKAEISRPRSSTYSDYQMRFVPINQKGKKENKQPLELIMLYGPHYSKAKELESKYVYNITRQLGKLHINLDRNYAERTPGRRIANNIDVIKTRLREDISKPLFMNAYMADAKIRGEEKLPVVISSMHSEMLDGYMSGIRQKIPMYYKEVRHRFKSDDYISEMIKKSSEYQAREDKTITAKEIKERRKFYMERLRVMEAEDIATIAKAQDMLKETIEKYGEKAVESSAAKAVKPE